MLSRAKMNWKENSKIAKKKKQKKGKKNNNYGIHLKKIRNIILTTLLCHITLTNTAN